MIAVHSVGDLQRVLVLHGKVQKELAESLIFWRLEFHKQLAGVLFALQGNVVILICALKNFVQVL